MKIKLPEVLVSLTLLITSAINAQSTIDTSEVPVWRDMMFVEKPNYYAVKKAFDKYWENKPNKKGDGYKQFYRWEQRVINRMLSDGTVQWNPNQLTDFIASTQNGIQNTNGPTPGQQIGSNIIPAAPCPQYGRWTPVGPYNSPYNQTGQPTGIGRINGVGFHPTDSNIIFACAPQGGVWKTINNGATWQILWGVNPGVNTIGASCIMVDATNTNILYLGTGDIDAGDAPGYGVLKSTNGGSSWSVSNTGMGNVHVGRIIIHPTNAAILLASTSSGVYRSTNSGGSWTRVSVNAKFTDVVFHPTDPNYVYATGNNGLFYRSIDNGATWTNITSGLPTASITRAQVAVSANGADYVYVLIAASNSGFNGLYRSTDKGLTFSTMSTTPNILGYSETGAGTGGQGWYDLDLAADPKNKDILYVAGINIWKSVNGGANWTVTAHWVGAGSAEDVHADQHSLEFNITGNKLYNGNDGGIYYTATAGKYWNNISNGIQNSQIYRITQAKTSEFVNNTGYQDNGSAVTTNDEFYTYYGGDGMDAAIDPTDANYIYGSYVLGRIYRAIDKTTTRTLGDNGVNGITEQGPWLTPFILREGNPGVMFAGYKNVWRCDDVKTNGTITWTKISNSLAGSNSVNMVHLENCMSQTKLLYALRGDNKLFRTSDATIATPTWTDLSATLPGSSRWLETHPTNSNIVYLAAGSTVYKSSDQGASWTGLAISGHGAVKCLVYDTSAGSEIIYAGTEKGVVVVNFSGTPSYFDYNNNFPLWADVSDIDLYYSPKGRLNSHVIVSTYGRGVYKSNLYDDGTLKPKANFLAFDSIFTVGGKLKLYEKCQNGVTSFKWTIFPSTGFNFVSATGNTSANPVIQFTTSGIYNVQLTASNCQGSDSLLKKYWIKVFPAPSNPICVNTSPYQTYNYSFGTQRIKLADNTSETGGYFDDGAYADFSANKVFRIVPSTSYTATFKSGLFNAQYERLYIDYNNNGRFENYRTEVYPSTIANIGTKTTTFTSPSSLLMNQGFRMRILNDYNPLDTNACKSLSYGTGEDYTVVYDFLKPYFAANFVTTCLNGNITFTDTSKGLINDWLWDFGSGASPASATGKGPHIVTYNTTGTKTVKLTINETQNLSKNNYINVTGTNTATALIKSGNATLCEGLNITLAARMNGSNPTFQWQKNNVNIPGKTDSLLSFTSILPGDAGNYRCLVSVGGCSLFSNTIAITVNPLPKVDFTKTSDQCFKGHSLTFTNTSTILSGSISSINWKFGDATTGTASPTVKKYSTSGTYIVKLIATSNLGCKDSTTKTTTIYPQTIAKYSVNDTDQCVNKNNYIFTNQSTLSSGTYATDWNFGDGNTSSATSPTYTYSAYGIYTSRLITTTNFNCKDTFTKPIRVYAKPNPSFTLNSYGQCLRGNKFIATNNSNIAQGTYTNKWDFGNSNTSTLSAPTFSYTSSQMYYVLLTTVSNFGCRDSFEVTVDVYPNPKATFTVNDSTQCKKEHTFIYTNNSTISTGVINTYNWNFGDATTSTLKNPSKKYVASSGIFNVQLIATSGAGCKDTFTKPVTLYASPTAAFSINNANQCKNGNNYIFSNSSSVTPGSIVSNNWLFGDGGSSTNSSPTYNYPTFGSFGVRLITTTNNNCNDTITKPVRIYASPLASFTVNPDKQCLKGNLFAPLNSSSIGEGLYTRKWDFGNTTTSTVLNPTIKYTAAGPYKIKLTLTSNFGCKDSTFVNVVVHPQTNTNFSINSAAQCLNGNQFVFTNNSSVSSGAFTSTWNYGNGNTQGIINGLQSYSTFGSYNVTLFNITNQNCKDTIVKSIRVYDSPVADFDVNSQEMCFRGNIFVAAGKAGVREGSYTSVWHNGDGSVSNTTNNTHNYAVYGNYNLKLVVTSNFGCKDSLTKLITVNPNPKAAFDLSKNDFCENENFICTNTSSIPLGSTTQQWKCSNNTNGILKDFTTACNLFGNYSIQLIETSNKGCVDTINKSVIIHSIPDVNFTVIPDKGCAKQTYFTYLNSSINRDGRSMTYEWDLGDGTTSSTISPLHKYNSAGTFPVKLKATGTICSNSKIINLVVSPTVSAAFIYDSINRETKKFYALDTLISGYSYAWTFGDGQQSSNKSVVHKYPTNDTFLPSLKVWNDKGCRDSANGFIIIYSPNYFAQNNGLNFYVYPNPTTQKFTYKFEINETMPVNIKIYTEKGQTLYSKDWGTLEKGVYYEEIDLGAMNLSAGGYPLRITAGKIRHTVKIIYTGK